MATYESLSDEDKAIVDNFGNLMRETSISLVRAMNRMQAMSEDTNAIAVFQSIDNPEVLPNRSDLAGSDSITKAQAQSVYTDWQTLLTNHNTTAARNLYSQFVGIINMVGG